MLSKYNIAQVNKSIKWRKEGNEMGLFSKKECDVCKKKMALMEGYKCADGTICNDCKKKCHHYLQTTKTQQ